MWKIIAITMIVVWIASQALMAVFCTWAVEKSLQKRDQEEHKEFNYYLTRDTTLNYKDPYHDPITKQDILGAYCTKEQAIAAMNKEVSYQVEALTGLTGHAPQVFDYPKWNAKEVYHVNPEFWKEHAWYSIHAF